MGKKWGIHIFTTQTVASSHKTNLIYDLQITQRGNRLIVCVVCVILALHLSVSFPPHSSVLPPLSPQPLAVFFSSPASVQPYILTSPTVRTPTSPVQ